MVERYGVPPELVTDLIGLKGDTSDNIPGVPGIGDKTAAQLLQEYGDLEGVLANIDKISGAKRKENLTNHAEDARDLQAARHRDHRHRLRARPRRADGGDRWTAAGCARSRASSSCASSSSASRRSSAPTSSPTPRSRRSSTPPPRQGGIADLAKGEVALAIAGGDLGAATTASASSAASARTCAGWSTRSGSRPLIGHDLKSLGGGARHGLLAAAGDGGLDLRHDTMVGAYLLDPARRTYDLVDIAAQRGLAPRRRKRDGGDDGDGQLELGEEPPPDPAAEARLVWEIAQLQRKGMKEQGLEKLMDEVEMPLVEVLAEMERTGVMLDAKRLADIGEGFEQRIEKLAGRDLRAGRATSSRSARRSSSPRSSSTSSG